MKVIQGHFCKSDNALIAVWKTLIVATASAKVHFPSCTNNSSSNMNKAAYPLLALGFMLASLPALRADDAPAAPAKPLKYQQAISVTSPAYCSDIKGDTTINVTAPGMTTAVVKCWKQGDGFGADSVVGTITFDASGSGSVVFPADS